MQSVMPHVVFTSASGALLFVRDPADLSRALGAVNHLIAGRRHADDILGVVVRRAGDRVDEGEVVLRHAVGLAGVWSLCAFDLLLRDDAPAHDDRRERLLAAVAPGAGCTFIPVWTAAEALAGGLDDAADALQRRFPDVRVDRDALVTTLAPRRLRRLADA